MTEFKREATYISYGHERTNVIDVHSARDSDDNTTFVAVNGNGDLSAELQGALFTEKASQETHVVTDLSHGSHLAARAILLSAAYQGNKETRTLVTTISPSDSGKLEDYNSLGFNIHMGMTRDKDRSGRDIPPEVILVNRTGGRRATIALGRSGIIRSKVAGWADNYDR